MRRSLHIVVCMAVLLSVTLMVEAQQRRSRRPRGSSSRSSLKKGDRAPDFKVHSVSNTGEVSAEALSLKDIVKTRPAALVFSSFT